MATPYIKKMSIFNFFSKDKHDDKETKEIEKQHCPVTELQKEIVNSVTDDESVWLKCKNFNKFNASHQFLKIHIYSHESLTIYPSYYYWDVLINEPRVFGGRWFKTKIPGDCYHIDDLSNNINENDWEIITYENVLETIKQLNNEVFEKYNNIKIGDEFSMSTDPEINGFTTVVTQKIEISGKYYLEIKQSNYEKKCWFTKLLPIENLYELGEPIEVNILDDKKLMVEK